MAMNVLKLALGVACLSLAATAAMSGEQFTGHVALTAASSTCPSGAASLGQIVTVSMLMPDGSAGTGPPSPSLTLSGEIYDFAVAGCTVSFARETTDRVTYAAVLDIGGGARERGCRCYCGL